MPRMDKNPRDGNLGCVADAYETYASSARITVPISSLTPVMHKQHDMHQWNQKYAF